MLIKEVVDSSNAKVAALIQLLTRRAEDTGSNKEISVTSFMKLANSLGSFINKEDIETVMQQEPYSNLFEPYDGSSFLRFKGNAQGEEPPMDMTVDMAQDIVSTNAKDAMKRRQ